MSQNNSTEYQSPTDVRRYSKSKSRSVSRSSNSKAGSYLKSPIKSGSYLKSPVRNFSKSRSPARNSVDKYSPPPNRSRGRRSPPRKYSRSRSPVYKKKYDRSYSPSPNVNRRYRRSRSRSSPRGGRGGGPGRRNMGNRENPSPSSCVGVFGLSQRTSEKDLNEFFERYGRIRNINLVMDKYSTKSLGYAFIYYYDIDSATRAKEEGAGADIDGRKIRVDYSITKKAHTPTPGVYMGKRSSRRRGRFDDSRDNSPEYHGRRSRDFERRRPHRSRSIDRRSRSRSSYRRSSSRSFGGYNRRDR